MAYRNYAPASGFIVAKDGNGDFATIQAAITAAPANTTVFIRPGSYTENLTLKQGVHLSSLTYGGAAIANIIGNCIDNGVSLSCTFTNIQLTTNSANLLTLTGAASSVTLEGSEITCSNNSGMAISTGSTVTLINCNGNLGTTGIAFWSGAGAVLVYNSFFTNAGASLAASTSSGTVFLYNTSMASVLSTSGIGAMTLTNCFLDCHLINTACLTTAGTGSTSIYGGIYISGTASAISAGTGTVINLIQPTISSSNTNALTGAGTIVSSGVIYTGTSHFSNATTQTGGAINGLTQGTAPSVGMIGEQIRATIGSGAQITVNNVTATNITSIALTPGIWDVSAVGVVGSGITTGSSAEFSISTTSATRGTAGDNAMQVPNTSNAANDNAVGLPSYRITLSANTTVYLVAFYSYTVGTGKGYGRISATRVG